MLGKLRQLWRDKTNQWLYQLRDREPGEVYLTRRRVFIVPTRPGFGFALLLVILLIGSTNYNLGLGFGLSFLAVAIGLVDMVQTFQNLAYLHLAPGRARPVFAGEEAQFELQIVNRSTRPRHAIWIDFLLAGTPRHVADAPHGAASPVVISWPTTQRGWLDAPRVRLVTRFPLGLFNAWAYWQPDLRVLVYPFPEASAPPLPLRGRSAKEAQPGQAGSDDFGGVRAYQAGDPMRHLAWRQIARVDPAIGGHLVTKRFEGGAADELVLDFAELPAQLDLELRLSRMTRWVLEAEQRALPYAFRLGQHDYPSALGDAHAAACLRALALYGGAGA